jgi:hypothetical protein
MATDPIRTDGDATSSVFNGDLPVRDKLERARTELLDLSARNRLLNMPRSGKGAKSVAVVDELSVEVFRLLAVEGKPFTFLPGRADGVENDPEQADGSAREEIEGPNQPAGYPAPSTRSGSSARTRVTAPARRHKLGSGLL